MIIIPTIFSDLYTVALFFSSLLLLKIRVLLRSLSGPDPPSTRSNQNRVDSIEAKYPAALYYSEQENPKSGATECAVCLSEFRKGESVRKLGCEHLFHRDCLDKWLMSPAGFSGPSCPLCRDRLALPGPEEEREVAEADDCDGGGEWGRREMLALLAKFREGRAGGDS
ncbi:unnamed protein product [Linum tenue]|uniref:RING-type domain-containing protein n=1 Tax=Linum tenue TaxID=586396 RepID=A0AAV0RB92_9ROSI|nr:unnamed protein product [Linum tenue]